MGTAKFRQVPLTAVVPGGLLAHALPEHAARDDRGSAGLAAGSGRSTNVAHEVGL